MLFSYSLWYHCTNDSRNFDLFPARQLEALLSKRQVLNKMTTSYEVNKVILLLSIHAHVWIRILGN